MTTAVFKNAKKCVHKVLVQNKRYKVSTVLIY